MQLGQLLDSSKVRVSAIGKLSSAHGQGGRDEP